MDPNLNQRRRRKTTLGTHCKPGDPPPRPGFMFPIPQARGLGRSRSVKKRPIHTPQLNQPSKEYMAKKRLFLKSPQSDLYGYNSQQDVSASPQVPGINYLPHGEKTYKCTIPPARYFPALRMTSPTRESRPSSFDEVLSSSERLDDKPTNPSTHDSGSFMDRTGIQAITTPSCNEKFTIPNLTSSQFREERQASILKSNTSSNIFTRTNSELPLSPGPSLYNQFILRELADIKPPVDPDDDIQLSSLSIEDKTRSPLKDSELKHNQITVSTSSDVFSPLPPLIRSSRFTYDSDKKKNSSILIQSEINGEINMDNDYLNTTDTFILAEQTVIDHNETLPTEQQNTTDTELDTVEELNQALDQIDKGIEYINNAKKEMCTLKSKIQRLVDKHKRLKNNTDIQNKENIAVKTVKTQHKWLSSLKTDNPSLLKMTPKPAKRSLNFLANQSLTWTPHSLSNVLNEQMDQLFE